MTMQNFHARSVFFVTDTPRATAFYTDTLGFQLDWTHEEKGVPYVVQISLHGMELILNQVEDLLGCSHAGDPRSGSERTFLLAVRRGARQVAAGK